MRPDGEHGHAPVIIHPARVEETAEGVRIAALIERETDECGGKELWYEFSGVDAAVWSGSVNGFVTALLLPAMLAGEPIRAHGRMSPALLRGLAEYQRVFHAWFPDRFQPVSISVDGYLPPCERYLATGTAFSGGVDSSYTLYSHLDAEPYDPEGKVRYAVFVHGFDIPLGNETAFADAAAIYRRYLPEMGVRLIEARTNVREFVDVASWELAHGSALGSVALMLDHLLGRFYVPASWSYAELGPWGSHPLTDPLMSTETLAIVHDGCLARIDKIARVAQWDLARSWLRVCWEKPHGSRNCCRCYNCVLTMVALEVSGRLDDCPTFPEALERSRIRSLRLPEEELEEVATVGIARAMEADRPDLAADLRKLVRRSRRALTWRRRLHL